MRVFSKVVLTHISIQLLLTSSCLSMESDDEDGYGGARETLTHMPEDLLSSGEKGDRASEKGSPNSDSMNCRFLI